jgi:CBS domain-containing protein
MKVGQLMTRDVECTRPDASVYEAARLMKDLDIGSLPVRGERDQLVGILTDRDIVVRGVAEGHDPVMTRVQSVMTQKVVTVFDDQDVTDAVRLMEAHQIRRIVVVDRSSRIVGIVSLGDVALDGVDRRLVTETLERVSSPTHLRQRHG